MNKNIYHRFAEVYDLMGADEHSVRMVEYTFKIFEKFTIPHGYGLDLCCGTGTALELFSSAGLSMAGLDGSARMLAVAAAKVRGRKITLFHKKLPRFKLVTTGTSGLRCQFDFITSFYDSLNYLHSQASLKLAFDFVHRHLHDNGWFIFDMNTLMGLRTIWDGQVYADARKDLAWIWRNDFDPKTDSATCRTTFFVRRGKTWERFDEDHVERAFPNSIIRRLLKEAGFVVKGFYECFTFRSAGRKTTRICVVARKV